MFILSSTILFATSGIQAQENVEDIATCLPAVYQIKFRVAGFMDSPTWIEHEHWANLHELSGIDLINPNNPVGYDVSNDSYPRFWLDAYDIADGTPVMIWIWAAPSTPDLWYWFMFNPGEYGADGRPHPCGVFAVLEEDSRAWLAEVFGND